MHFAAFGISFAEILLIAIVLGCFGFWIWMIVDTATKEIAGSRVAWLVVIAILGILGAIVYFFAKKLPRSLRKQQNPAPRQSPTA